MKKIYDTVKSIQNQPVVRYRLDEDYDNEYNAYDDDYSEDEGTSAPVTRNHSTNTFTSKPEVEEPYSKLLSGYTNENWEINVNDLNVHNEKLIILITFL